MDHSIHLYDMKTGKERTVYNGHRGTVVVAYSPDGKTAATAAGDGTVRFRDPRTGEQRRCSKTTKRMCCAWPIRRTASCWPPAAASPMAK